MKLTEIATRLGARLEPPGAEVEITGVAGIEEAAAGQLTFVANPKYSPLARTTRAGAVIVDDKFPALDRPTLRTPNPYLAFARALDLFYQPPHYAPGVHPTAVIDPSARIGKDAHIGAYCVVDAGVEIGDGCTLLPHVVIYRGVRIGNHFLAHAHAVVREFCRIGNNVVLQNGVIVGADGFGFAKDGDRWSKIVQSGPTVIEDDVEIQANSCVDRATVGETRIANGVKIDNLVQVGHGSAVGDNTLICAQVGIAGSSVIGKSVILAGQVGIVGHGKIGDGAVVTAQSGVPGDVAPGATVSGSPSFDHRQWMRSIAVFPKLPEIAKAVRARAKDE